jgi:Biotin-lipoyl like
MMVAFLITFIFGLFVWLVFFKFKWLKFTKTWGIVTGFFGLHIFLIFVVGLRFVTPFATNVRVVQHTIQLIPRLPEPTLVTAVLVTPDVPVKKGQPLFQFDRRPYEYQVRLLEAQMQAAFASATSARYKVEQLKAGLAAANQDVRMYKADLDAAEQKTVRSKSDLEYAKYQQQLSQGLAQKGAGTEEDAQKWTAQMNATRRTAAGLVQTVPARFTSALRGKIFGIRARPLTQNTPRFNETRKFSSTVSWKRSIQAVTMAGCRLDGCMFFPALLLLCDTRGTACKCWRLMLGKWLRADALSLRQLFRRETKCVACSESPTASGSFNLYILVSLAIAKRAGRQIRYGSLCVWPSRSCSFATTGLKLSLL